MARTSRKGLRILYGGSVKPDNAKALMSENEIDGALVGGASSGPEIVCGDREVLIGMLESRSRRLRLPVHGVFLNGCPSTRKLCSIVRY